MRERSLLIRKDHFLLLLLFVFYGFLLIPLGDYKHPERPQASFYSIQTIDPGDDAGYYSYVRSGIIDGDFDFFNEKKYWHFDTLTSAWYSANYWPMGQAILWIPFFIAGHAIAGLFILLGYQVAADGYSFPYHALTSIASSCETFLALLICYELLKRFFSRGVCLATTTLIFTTTSLSYYTFIRNRMSHSGDVLISFIFFLLFIKFYKKKNQPLSFYVLCGVFAGFLIDLRYINVVYMVIPLAIFIETFIPGRMENAQRKKTRFGLMLGGIAFIIMIFPQLTAWKVLHGIFSPMNPLQTIVEPSFFGVISSIGDLFFETSWGLAFNEPIWLIGLAGLILYSFKDHQLGILCLLIFIGFCVTPVILGNGNSFGQRYMLSALPVLAVGLGYCIDLTRKKIPHFFLIIIGVLLSGWLYILLLNYKIILPYNAPHFAVLAFKNIPSLVSNTVFFRPTTFADYLVKGNYGLVNYYDYFFLIFFPILQAGIPLCILLLFFLTLKKKDTVGAFQNYATKALPAIFLLFMGSLTIFILVRHPQLEPDIKKERLQLVAVSNFIKEFPDLDNFHRTTKKLEEMDDKDEITYLIIADSRFAAGSFKEAKLYYIKALAISPNSTAAAQLDRIKLLTGEKVLSERDLMEKLKNGDPGGEINRWLGFYYLDKMKRPDIAIIYFQRSININPKQQQSGALKAIILQYLQQKQRLIDRGIPQKSLPQIYNHILNTYINSERLNSISLLHHF